jgi:hypothetical protein
MRTSIPGTIPAIGIKKSDGLYINSLFNSTTTVYISIISTGPALPAEATAVRNLISAVNWTPNSIKPLFAYGVLPEWTELITNSALDPCSGVAGIYCENGHIIGLIFYQTGMNIIHTGNKIYRRHKFVFCSLLLIVCICFVRFV